MKLLFGLLVSLLALTTTTQAAWQLDETASSISFNSIKKGQVVESHYFKTIHGAVNDCGEASISVELTSVETGISIRNDRLASMLFETVKFPAASIQGDIPLSDIRQMAIGQTMDMTLELTLKLHGMEQTVRANVLVSSIGADAYQIASQKPVIVTAKAFGLEAGIEALRLVASLDAITGQIPVNFNLIFRTTTDN